MDLFKTKTSKLLMMTAVAAVLALGATNANADGVNGGSATGTVTVTMQNTVTVAETTPIDFGTIVAITDNAGGNLDIVMTNAGVVTWPGLAAQAAPWNPTGGAADIGTATKARAFPTGVRAHAAGVFDITGAAFDANMGIIYNNTSVNGADARIPLGGGDETSLTCGACAPGAPTLLFGDVTDNTGGDGIIQADGAGAITLNIGGTLRLANNIDNTNLTGSSVAVAGAVEDGDYVGNFIVSAIY